MAQIKSYVVANKVCRLKGKKIFIDADPIAISITFFFILLESSKHKTRSPGKQVEGKSKNKCLLLLQQKLFCFSICWFSGFNAQNTRARLLTSFGSLPYASPRNSFCDTGKKSSSWPPAPTKERRRFHRFVIKLTVSYLDQKNQIQVKYSKNNSSIPEHV